MNKRVSLQIEAEYFDHDSDWHGVEHTLRVIRNVRQLGETAQLNEAMIRTVECAAFLHDMARQHDRECSEHGRWAVERKLPLHLKTFLDYGVPPEALEALAFAVTYHCRHDAPQDSSHKEYLALLKKADAMDRSRFPWEDIEDFTFEEY